MSHLIPIVSTAFIPLVSLTSFTIYLSVHPASPVRSYFVKPIALPTHRNEGLAGHADRSEKDPFDLEDPVVCEDGTPVDPAHFWASMKLRKIAALLLMLPPFMCNILLLVFTILARIPEQEERTRSILLPALLLPSQIVTLVLISAHIAQSETYAHWATTVHLAIDIFVQFMILAFLALLPSTPMPSAPSQLLATFSRSDLLSLPQYTRLEILQSILPVLYVPPLIVILTIRRGPPLYLPLQALYPAKITEAVPDGTESLDPTKPNVSAEVQATVPEWLLFGYATGVVWKGHVSESLDVWDLPILPKGLRALVQYRNMRSIYGNPRGRFGRTEGFNLLWKVAKANAGLLWAQTLLATATAFGYYIPHYILLKFVEYLENDPSRSTPAWGWVLCFGLFMSNAIMFIATGVTWSISSTYLQGRIKLQLNTLLFSKTLRKKDIAAAGDDKGQVGDVKAEAAKDQKRKEAGGEEDNEDEEAVSSKTQIMTLFTVDVDRVTDFVFHLFAVVDSPLELLVASVFVYKLLGTSALYGLLTAILSLPLNHFASKIVVRAQENLMKTRDQRTALMNEILQGIRMLKFMAWERSFESRIQMIRKNELSWQARNYQIEVAFNCIWALTPVLVTVVSFLHYTLVRGQRLTPSTAFTSVAVFAELRYALNALPETFIQALQGFVSCRRIEKYLSLAEVAPIEENDGSGDILLSSATYTWPRDDSATSTARNGVSRSTATTPKNAFTLADLTLRFPKGKLSLICGRLGQVVCPRSSPDSMASFHEGAVPEEKWVVPNMVAFVPQQAWLQNATIKDNIVFSSPWSEQRYQQVLEACSLTTDLEILEDGDQTEIGEKGLNLSGGQKARVSLARAVYSRAGTLLLDDVLSAVDAHTAHALMANCLQGRILEGRTVLLVSHHTALVSPGASYIVALENGDVKFSGTRDDFVASGLMAKLDEEDVKAKPAEEEKILDDQAIKPAHKSVISLTGAAASEPGSETSSLAPEDESTLVNCTVDVKAKAPRKLIEDEKRARGRIAWSVWKAYFGALGGPVWWIFFVLALAMAMFVPVAEKGWLEYWTGSNLSPEQGGHTTQYFVIGYAVITIAGVFAANFQYAIIYLGSLRASRVLHNAMLESVLFSTLRFHDTTSRGRLLNRFGKDIEGLDSSTADNFVRSVAYALNVIVTLVSITYVGGVPFIIAGSVILVIYYQAGSIYGQTSRDMRRLDSVTRSPLYSLFGEAVSGVAVLRAFGASTISLKHMMRLADTNLLAFAWSWTVNRWLSARFNLLSAIMVGFTAVAILIAPGVDAAMAGFALSFAGTICHDLLFVVRRFVQLEQSMVAIERLKEFTDLKREANEYVDPRPPASWPESGAIVVEDLIIRYAPDLPDVLHSISFKVNPREKIGIVGATGCGKSTLALSFFRFVEATQGRIVIDNIDISKIGLTDLRSRVTIIPQDPTILSGTLRSTLDVFDEYDDADIYAALRRVHLIKDEDLVRESDATDGDEETRNKNVFRDLNNPVSEGGDNFSSGEKQLICMARAILKRNKLLFMDEATASIDYETDELISKTIREEFSDSTILTIAHRIHTIIDFDKVLVMDQGRIAEFASPAELLRDHRSKFYSLCKATGRTEFKNLKTMALEAERKKNRS
ncbi:uncharacterized protein I303_108450 [Kwoniella dejecticola CBS 10117]|uniref:ATP-binding cassette transporter n=1 Tax=Kwoniella dejecticola CBS 10117 TaxID=1296121 RepID=A0AAJ8MLK7_9TREE